MTPVDKKLAKKYEELFVDEERIRPVPDVEVFLKVKAYPRELEVIVNGTKRDINEPVKMYFCELKVIKELPDEKDIWPTEVTFIELPEEIVTLVFERRLSEEDVL